MAPNVSVVSIRRKAAHGNASDASSKRSGRNEDCKFIPTHISRYDRMKYTIYCNVFFILVIYIRSSVYPVPIHCLLQSVMVSFKSRLTCHSSSFILGRFSWNFLDSRMLRISEVSVGSIGNFEASLI